MAFFDLPLTPWFASGALTSPELRHAFGALVQVPATANIGSETGVFPSLNGLLVSGGSGQVTVQPGACVVQTPVGGTYVVTIAGNTPLTITAQASNARIDLVCIQVLDNEADSSGTSIRARLIAVEGTAAASPAVPATPSGYLKLAEIRVSSSGITNIVDKRQFTRAAGGIRVGTDDPGRNGSYPGDVQVWANGRIDIWTGSKWVSAAAPSVWSQKNIDFVYQGGNGRPEAPVGFGPTGAHFVRYKRAGNDLTVSYRGWFDGSGAYDGGSGDIYTTLPEAGMVTPAGRDQWIPCQLWVNDASSGVVLDWAGMALIQSSSSILWPYFPMGTGSYPNAIKRYRIATTPATAGGGVPYIANGYPQGGAIHIGPGVIELA